MWLSTTIYLSAAQTSHRDVFRVGNGILGATLVSPLLVHCLCIGHQNDLRNHELSSLHPLVNV
ncbi:hypothetical protein BDW22DRAFT_1356015 [Trametopsis cervina]|nr:hypothetical protein BDW22DRAFT_1356015 [Trametopsis cervina]